MSRVQDIVQQRLAEDERLHYLPPEAVHNELMQDMDRYVLSALFSIVLSSRSKSYLLFYHLDSP